MFGIADTNTLMIVALIVGASGFFAGLAMNGVLEEDGFGVIGNMMILIAGAVIGLQLGGVIRLPFDTAIADAVRAISGAFLALALLSVAKTVLRRFGF